MGNNKGHKIYLSIQRTYIAHIAYGTIHDIEFSNDRSKYESGGPLVFEIWRPHGGPLVTSYQGWKLFAERW